LLFGHAEKNKHFCLVYDKKIYPFGCQKK
jgi:hypothetical protein